MKLLLASAFFISTVSFAQTIDVSQLKNLMTQNKTALEKVNQGMSKRVVTTSRIATELGPCEVLSSAVQTILRVDGEKMIIHSKESYRPAATPACAGFESQEAAVLFYEDKPTLANDLSDLDQTASQIKTISRSGDLVTLNLSATAGTRTENVTVKYDLSKPSFKNALLIQDSTSKVETSDIADINVNTIDLKNVLFCESAESENCVQGDYSDILF